MKQYSKQTKQHAVISVLKYGKLIIIYFFVILFIMITLQSCGLMALRGNYAPLTHNATYQSVDLELASSFERFNLEAYLGAGKVDIAKSDLDYTSQEKEDAGKISFSVGAGATYYFTTTRFQPFMALEFHDIPWGIGSKNEDQSSDEIKKGINGYYFTIEPKAGARFYISNKIALNGTLGYQMGNLKINDQKNKLSGFMPSIGLVFIFAK